MRRGIFDSLLVAFGAALPPAVLLGVGLSFPERRQEPPLAPVTAPHSADSGRARLVDKVAPPVAKRGTERVSLRSQA